ncbi:MAG: hypothetical protein E6Q88_00360 [Lysobacteraceae bacterium]|nr:MAG: hypothetical protein E6Q88_00360 [Xanthomonadaceae bacterium]
MGCLTFPRSNAAPEMTAIGASMACGSICPDIGSFISTSGAKMAWSFSALRLRSNSDICGWSSMKTVMQFGWAILLALPWIVTASPAMGEATDTTLTAEDLAQIRTMLRDVPVDVSGSNRHVDDPDAIAFGREAFFSHVLSRNRETACVTCHDPARHWTDARDVAIGGTRNTPPLWNLRGALWMGWTGRADSLWAQVARVVENEREFSIFRASFLRRIVDDSVLRDRYEVAFGTMPAHVRTAPSDCGNATECRSWWDGLSIVERDAIDTAFIDACKGISAFVAGIKPPRSRFFEMVERMRDDAAAQPQMDARELRGFRLFSGKAGCTMCHHGSTLSDGEFHNIRLRRRSADDEDDRYAGLITLRDSDFNLLSRHNDAPDRVRHTGYVRPDYTFLNSFRTPSLTGIGHTAPYMHDGRFATLAEVVDYYSEFKGAAEAGHHETVLLKPLFLSPQEKADLVAFLGAL